MREASVPLVPTFVAFTPWTTMSAYVDLLEVIDSLDLVDHVPPVQWSIRLLIPAGSRLLGLSEIRDLVGPFDPLALAYPWRHSDPTRGCAAADGGRSRGAERREPCRDVRGDPCGGGRSGEPHADTNRACESGARRPRVPYLTEPWYCCAEPTEGQAALI